MFILSETDLEHIKKIEKCKIFSNRRQVLWSPPAHPAMRQRHEYHVVSSGVSLLLTFQSRNVNGDEFQEQRRNSDMHTYNNLKTFAKSDFKADKMNIGKQ